MAIRNALGQFVRGGLSDFLGDLQSQMQWQPVTSSNVAEIAYNEGTNTLGVRFLNGSEYNYFDVDPDTYYSFESASSPGGFLHAFIKGRFAYERVS